MTGRKAQINPDSMTVLIIALVILGIMSAWSFMMSFASLAAVGSWAAHDGWLGWGVPIIVDLAIVAFSLAVLIFRARDEGLAFARCMLVGFTVISAAANAAYAIDAGSLSAWQTYVGAFVAALAPLSQFVTVHAVARLVVATPEEQAEMAESAEYAEKVDSVRNERDAQIISLASAGVAYRNISERVGASTTTVARVMKKWKSAKEEAPEVAAA